MKVVVGQGSCGVATGARKTSDELERLIAEKGLTNVAVDLTGCVGTCYLEPIVDVYGDDGALQARYVKVQPDKAAAIVEEHLMDGRIVEDLAISRQDEAFLSQQKRIVLRNCGVINPEHIEEYIAAGGYEAAKKAVTSMTPQQVIEEVRISGLRGRGGAGFPTWFKWNAARQNQADQKYMVCNADEGDPGAFMDRSVLEGDPHSVLEGMLIGGYAIGASQGVIYVRAEYPLAIKRLEIAMAQARERGFLGQNLFGTGFSFDIRIKAGAGAFVCGEETALIASLEGERGMPRLKPPFPAQRGYWQKPTNINNVETFANVPWVLLHGGAALAAIGTEKSAGTKVFALAGKIKKGGLVEVPMGLPIRDIIFGIGGGIKNDKAFKAVQMGGPSGGCIPAELAGTTVDYESIPKTGAIVGSGGMIVMDDRSCMVEVARYYIKFLSEESCGKCTPCREGLRHMLAILTDICEGRGQESDLELLEQICDTLEDASLCALGKSAPNPVRTTMKYFREEYEAHIKEHRCPAGVCTALTSFVIDPNKCVGCGACTRACPAGVISGGLKEPHSIDNSRCIVCGSCREACRFDAVEAKGRAAL